MLDNKLLMAVGFLKLKKKQNNYTDFKSKNLKYYIANGQRKILVNLRSLLLKVQLTSDHFINVHVHQLAY